MKPKIDSVNIYETMKENNKNDNSREGDKIIDDTTRRSNSRLIEFPKGEYRTNGRNLSRVKSEENFPEL